MSPIDSLPLFSPSFDEDVYQTLLDELCAMYSREVEAQKQIASLKDHLEYIEKQNKFLHSVVEYSANRLRTKLSDKQ